MRRAALIATIIVASFAASAQVETTQSFMNALPQVVENNPAFLPKYKFALGLPFSNVGVHYTNSGFTYNDLRRQENGKQIADFSQLASRLPAKSFVSVGSHFDLFRLGLLLRGKYYLSVSSALKGYSQVMVPRDLVSLVADGNGSFVGKTVNVSPSLNATSYMENSVGFSFSPIDKLTTGIRVKQLFGFVNARTETADLFLSVADNYAVTLAADLRVMTSGVENIDGPFSFPKYSKNAGFGVDLGATYEILPKLKLSASLIDIGMINWKNNTVEYALDKTKATYTFGGIDLQKVLDNDASYIEGVMDSIQAKFEPVQTIGAAYRSSLPAKMFIGGTYEPLRNLTVGATFFAEQFGGRTATGLTAAANKNFGRFFSTALSYTVSNRSYNNLGAGLSINLAPVQIYVVGDNLLRLPITLASTGYVNNYLNSSQLINLRLGVNFVWGWRRDGGANDNSSPTGGEDGSKGFNKKKPTPHATAGEDNSSSFNNSGKKKAIPHATGGDDNSKSFNAKKKQVKTTTNMKKHSKAAHLRARKKRR